MMLFLHWICETYIAKKRKRRKRKSVNQYWRDFKMLYRRVNGRFVDANDSDEIYLFSECRISYLKLVKNKTSIFEHYNGD
jgi:hypothetical protein